MRHTSKAAAIVALSLFLASTCHAASGAIRSEVALDKAKKKEQSLTLINTQLPSDGYEPQSIDDSQATGGSYEQNLIVKGNPDLIKIQDIDDSGDYNSFTQNGVVSDNAALYQGARSRGDENTYKQNGAVLGESYLNQITFNSADYSNFSQNGAVIKSDYTSGGFQGVFNRGDHATSDQKLLVKSSTDGSSVGQAVKNVADDSTFHQEGAVIKGNNSRIFQKAFNALDDTSVDQSAKSLNDTDSSIFQKSITVP